MEGSEEHRAPEEPDERPEQGFPPAVEPHESRLDRVRRAGHHTRVWTSVVLLVAALVILIALIVDNTHQVRINWVFGDSTAALVWIVVVAGIVGWIAGLATAALLRRRTRRARS